MPAADDPVRSETERGLARKNRLRAGEQKRPNRIPDLQTRDTACRSDSAPYALVRPELEPVLQVAASDLPSLWKACQQASAQSAQRPAGNIEVNTGLVGLLHQACQLTTDKNRATGAEEAWLV